MTFEVLPRETPQERAAAIDALTKGVTDGDRNALRAALSQSRGSSDAIAVALEQMAKQAAEKGTHTRPVSPLTYEEQQGRYDEWKAAASPAELRLHNDVSPGCQPRQTGHVGGAQAGRA